MIRRWFQDETRWCLLPTEWQHQLVDYMHGRDEARHSHDADTSSGRSNNTSINRRKHSTIDWHSSSSNKPQTSIDWHSTTDRSKLESTMHEKEICQLAVGQMIAIMRTMQQRQQYMSQEQMNPMKVSQLRSYLTTRNTHIRIQFLQKLVEEGSVSIILTLELTTHRLTSTFHHRSTTI